jgi:hypothetical protein
MRRTIAIFSLILLFIIISGSGCRKKVFQTDSTYAEEMINFIENDLEGKDLYTKELFSQNPFVCHDTLLHDTLHQYFYAIDTINRRYSVDIAQNRNYVYPFDSVFDALVKIEDSIYARYYRINGIDTTPSYKVISAFTRYAYFVKLYNDSYLYRGWLFWGFIGGKYDEFQTLRHRIVFSSAGDTMSADPPIYSPPKPNPPLDDSGHVIPYDCYFITADAMPDYALGDTLTLLSNARDFVHCRISDSAIIGINATQYNHRYRAGWRLSDATTIHYNLILFDMPSSYFRIKTIGQTKESTLVKINSFIIPYKIDI